VELDDISNIVSYLAVTDVHAMGLSSF